MVNPTVQNRIILVKEGYQSVQKTISTELLEFGRLDFRLIAYEISNVLFMDGKLDSINQKIKILEEKFSSLESNAESTSTTNVSQIQNEVKATRLALSDLRSMILDEPEIVISLPLISV